MPRTAQRTIALPEVGGVERAPGVNANHRMPGAGDRAFLRDAVRLEIRGERSGLRITAEVRVTNVNAGHHIPTGHPSRNMLLVVSARDAQGHDLELISGRTLPTWAGMGERTRDYAGRPGKGYAKVLEEAWTGVWPTIAYWNPTRVREDTRIPARATDVTRYVFEAPAEPGPVRLQGRLVFRRAFRELARRKKWRDADITIARTDAVVR